MEHKMIKFDFEGWECSCGSKGYCNSDFKEHKEATIIEERKET